MNLRDTKLRPHQSFKDPRNKYMKMEDLLAMNLSRGTLIELTTSPDARDDRNRGESFVVTPVYFLCLEEGRRYDTLIYAPRMFQSRSGGREVYAERRVILPIIDGVRVVRALTPRDP